MLVNRWGILWQPMRCDLRKVPRVVLVCMKLHNFIIDQGNSAFPDAIVYEEPRNGTKGLPLTERARLTSPGSAQFLNVMAGMSNTTTQAQSSGTRDCIRAHLAMHGFRRPGVASSRCMDAAEGSDDD
jgi:hypothetical protein